MKFSTDILSTNKKISKKDVFQSVLTIFGTDCSLIGNLHPTQIIPAQLPKLKRKSKNIVFVF